MGTITPPSGGRLFQGVDKGSAAFKLMKSMGWEEGTGLGKNKQGIVTHVRVAKKNDNCGVGIAEAKKAGSDWTVNTAVFDTILKNLNVQVAEQNGGAKKKAETESESSESDSDSASDSESEEESEGSAQKLEEPIKVEPKLARPQGRYKRREAGKEVRAYSQTDLSAILGHGGDAKEEKMHPSLAKWTTPKPVANGTAPKVADLQPAVPSLLGRQLTMPPGKDWWGSKYGFVRAGQLGSMPAPPTEVTTAGRQADDVAGRSEVAQNGFSEQDQENLYHLVQDNATTGRRGLGIADAPKKVAGARWKGSKVTFSDTEEEQPANGAGNGVSHEGAEEGGDEAAGTGKGRAEVGEGGEEADGKGGKGKKKKRKEKEDEGSVGVSGNEVHEESERKKKGKKGKEVVEHEGVRENGVEGAREGRKKKGKRRKEEREEEGREEAEARTGAGGGGEAAEPRGGEGGEEDRGGGRRAKKKRKEEKGGDEAGTGVEVKGQRGEEGEDEMGQERVSVETREQEGRGQEASGKGSGGQPEAEGTRGGKSRKKEKRKRESMEGEGSSKRGGEGGEESGEVHGDGDGVGMEAKSLKKKTKKKGQGQEDGGGKGSEGTARQNGREEKGGGGGTGTGTVKWRKLILSALKEGPSEGVKLKKLRKGVLGAAMAALGSSTPDKTALQTEFERQLERGGRFVVEGQRVRLAVP